MSVSGNHLIFTKIAASGGAAHTVTQRRFVRDRMMSAADGGGGGPPAFHRGDGLDVPLIDGHVLSGLLLPRLTSAIKYVLPDLHADWSADAAAGGTALTPTSGKAVAWRRLVEAVLHAVLLAGSCRFLAGKDGEEGSAAVGTPAMHSLGVAMRPVGRGVVRPGADKLGSRLGGREARRGPLSALLHRIQTRLGPYSKVAALVLATAVLPRLYAELARRRGRVLEERDREVRLAELRREYAAELAYYGNSSSGGSNRGGETRGGDGGQLDRDETPASSPSPRSLIRRRAAERLAAVVAFLSDAVLGLGELVLPPLRLANYVAYLWGLTGAPGLGATAAGWEYAPSVGLGSGISAAAAASSVGSGNSGGISGASVPFGRGFVREADAAAPHRRHANFQYGIRRLMVEEGLRTARAMLPDSSTAGGGGDAHLRGTDVDDDRRGSAGEDDGEGEEDLPAAGLTGRLASLLGLRRTENNGATTKTNRRCGICRTRNPVVPYVTDCGHVYCYVCLRLAATDGMGCDCAVCGRAVRSSGRLAAASPDG